MGYVIRSFKCDSQRCGVEFDSSDDSPRCEGCGGYRVHWIPKGGHIAKSAPHLDRVLRAQADRFGLTNLKSARAGERMEPDRPQPKMLPHTPMFSPGAGAHPIPIASEAYATFTPTHNKISGNLPVGAKFNRPRGNRIPTQIVGRHDGKIT